MARKNRYDKIYMFKKLDKKEKSQISSSNLKKNQKVKKNKSEPKFKSNQIFEGKLDHVSTSFGFVIVEGREKDIKVIKYDLMGAFHGDIVKVRLVKEYGKIIKIIERLSDEFVGVIKKEYEENYIVKLDGKRMHHDILISNKKDLNKATDGDKVIVKIKKWPDHKILAQGYIKKILGRSGEHSAEMNSIMFEFGLPENFPKEVLSECNSFEETISKEEIEKRKDFRKILTFTIDPENAKDYDDALSIRELENGNYEIGVHIADASYYVKQSSAIDKEAYERGNSVYLVDRTIPMLPEILSNGLCSLRPNEESLTVSAVFEINKKGDVLSAWVGEGIIFSRKRFIYEESSGKYQ